MAAFWLVKGLIRGWEGGDLVHAGMLQSVQVGNFIIFKVSMRKWKEN